jgi:hypothetical protein
VPLTKPIDTETNTRLHQMRGLRKSIDVGEMKGSLDLNRSSLLTDGATTATKTFSTTEQKLAEISKVTDYDR